MHYGSELPAQKTPGFLDKCDLITSSASGEETVRFSFYCSTASSKLEKCCLYSEFVISTFAYMPIPYKTL
ncbi:hypothetical protein C4E24_05000 [ANME-1 cluster archaeon AG-394-G21]|nr:hypothetical protein [ANME-1 cluster archaeon AG-394-G21]